MGLICEIVNLCYSAQNLFLQVGILRHISILFFLKMSVLCMTTVSVNFNCQMQQNIFTRFLNALGFPADSFQQVAYMAVGMMERGLASFAMLLLNFYFEVDFIL